MVGLLRDVGPRRRYSCSRADRPRFARLHARSVAYPLRLGRTLAPGSHALLRRRLDHRSSRRRARRIGERGLSPGRRRRHLRSALVRGGRRRRDARRQKSQRIDVALVVARHANAEVDERLYQINLTARANGADHRPLVHERTSLDADRTEMQERRGVAERRLDRHRLATCRDRAGEGDDPVRRCEHRAAARRPQVDTSMLAGGVGVRAVEGKRSQHRSVDRPRPRTGNRHRQRGSTDDHQNDDSPHDSSLVASFENESRR
jgi:hypothetical protein